MVPGVTGPAENDTDPLALGAIIEYVEYMYIPITVMLTLELSLRELDSETS